MAYCFLDYKNAIKQLPVIAANKALKLQALVDFDDKGTKRVAGDEWQVEGPCTYYPRPECKQISTVEPMVITYGTALMLSAKRDLKDRNGKDRVTGKQLPSVE